MIIGLYVLAFVIGACLGSFLCCQARRLHLRDQAKGKHKRLNKRSICLHCKKKLKWYDNIPIFSWLILRGKCRRCHKKIGLAELLSELGTGIALLATTATFNFSISGDSLTLSNLFTTTAFTASIPSIIIYIITILLTLTLIFLAIYDGLYGELPSLCLIIAIVFGALITIIRIYSSLMTAPFTPSLITDPLFAVLILGGLYLVLYLISKGKWVGDGDWLLATAIALALGSPWLALIALFIANLTACIVCYPLVKSRRSHKIHFGPFLVIAFIITYSFSSFFLNLIA